MKKRCFYIDKDRKVGEHCKTVIGKISLQLCTLYTAEVNTFLVRSNAFIVNSVLDRFVGEQFTILEIAGELNQIH